MALSQVKRMNLTRAERNVKYGRIILDDMMFALERGRHQDVENCTDELNDEKYCPRRRLSSRLGTHPEKRECHRINGKVCSID